VFDVICVGSATIDVYAHTDAELIKIHTRTSEEELIAYPVGTKILINKLNFEIGGGGTNTAVAFARLGLRTAFLGNVGSDANSQKILALLEKENISFIGQKNGTAAYSIILDSIEEDRTILTYKGASDSFSLSTKGMRGLKTRWIYASSMMGASFKTLCSLAIYARKKGIHLAFNPSTYLVELGEEALRPILRAATALIFNKDEARILTGLKDADIPALMRVIHAWGIPFVSITDGRVGSYVSDRAHILFCPPGKVHVVETTGAGDAFASAFVSSLIWGKDLETSLRIGMIEAESVISHLGPKNILLTRSQLDRLLRKDKHRIVRMH
jgi:ribokinase